MHTSLFPFHRMTAMTMTIYINSLKCIEWGVLRGFRGTFSGPERGLGVSGGLGDLRGSQEGVLWGLEDLMGSVEGAGESRGM